MAGSHPHWDWSQNTGLCPLLIGCWEWLHLPSGLKPISDVLDTNSTYAHTHRHRIFLEIVKHRIDYFWYKLLKLLTFRMWSLRKNFENIIYKIVNNAEFLLWISNIHHRDQWKRQIHACAYPHTQTHSRAHTYTYTHTYTHIYTHTNTHTHTCTHTHIHAHTHKQGVTLHILVSGISSEGALELRFGATAQVHETNFVNRCDAWRGYLIRQHKMSFYKFC